MEGDDQFWKLILQDHLFFIYSALAKDEIEVIELVKELYNNFSGSRGEMEEILQLKKDILARLLSGMCDISLDPTFLNHMINEAEEAINPSTDAGSLHKLWLLDVEGHLITIKKMLDPVEKQLMRLIKKDIKTFNALFCKTLEFIGYLRSGVTDFPALVRLTNESATNVRIYLELITEIGDGLKSGETLGTIKPIMIDHMLREQSFYLHKLGQDGGEFAVDYLIRGVEIPYRL